MSGEHDDLDLGVTLRGFDAGQTVFGRYRLEKVLGRGGMGVVWLARDEKLDQKVALKFLPELVARDRLAVDDLKRETKRALALTHEHIVRIYDFVEDEARGLACISMEYVDGENLSHLRLEKPQRCFEAGELGGVVIQLCEALEYAHGKAKVAHRDLKPANLMITSQGDLKVTDFGIARSLVDSVSRVSAATGSSSGTLAYMSSQQAQGRAAKALDDIYALGATLYDLLTGKPPFYSGNIMHQVENVMPPSMAGRRAELEVTSEPIPEQWERTIAACLDKDPAKRPQSAGEVAYRLGLAESYTAQPKVEIPQPEVIRVGRETKPEPKRGNGALVAALILLLGCGGLAGWWFGVEQPKRDAELKQQTAAAVAQQLADEAAEQKRQLDDAAAVAAEKARADEAAAMTTAAEEQKREAQSLKSYLDGLDYLFGNQAKGVLIDNAKGTLLIQKAAVEGLPEAEARMAVNLNSDNGLQKDEGAAQEWAKKAIEQGLVKKAQDGGKYAELELGGLYNFALGMPQDYTKAFEFYQKASDQGLASAQYNLGLLYFYGEGVPRDLAKFVELLRRTADMGYSVAQFHLGMAYTVTGIVPQDYTKAVELLQKAADQRHGDAQNELGWLYENGTGVTRDYVKAAELYQNAADEGDVFGQFHLGRLYENGTGVTRDYSKACQLFQKAADLGDPNSQFELGKLYEQGLGVPQNYAKAAELYQKATDKGLASAMYSLGALYEQGLGVPKNADRAKELKEPTFAKYYIQLMSDVKAAASKSDKIAQLLKQEQEQDQTNPDASKGDRLQKLVAKLLDLSTSDPEAEAIVKKWKIRGPKPSK